MGLGRLKVENMRRKKRVATNENQKGTLRVRDRERHGKSEPKCMQARAKTRNSLPPPLA